MVCYRKAMTTEPFPSPPRERPGASVRGPWVVAATLSLFLIVPAISVGAWFLLVDRDPSADAPAPLVWAERADWPRSQFTVFKSLERGQMSSARTQKVHNEKIGLVVTAEEILAIQRCAVLARQPLGAFMGNDTRDALQQEVQSRPDLFYGHYLLGTWHRLREDTQAADAAYTRAFRHAPAALLRHHVDADGQTAVDAPVPDLALVADRIVDDHLDASVVLIYPHLRTGGDGFIYLPVYKAILRETDADRPIQRVAFEDKPAWFTFFGPVGRRPDVTLK